MYLTTGFSSTNPNTTGQQHNEHRAHFSGQKTEAQEVKELAQDHEASEVAEQGL